MNWANVLQPYEAGPAALFDEAFLKRWGDASWGPNDDDRNAAAKLHLQLISRVTTQRLGYLDGVEKRALTSVYELFEETRKLCTENVEGRHFEILSWHVLNTHVRPFTAKWHSQSERGMLQALDATDVFRAELEELRGRLVRFQRLLEELRGGGPTPANVDQSADTSQTTIEEEMKREVRWGIRPVGGNIAEQLAKEINTAEETAIKARRTRYPEFYPSDKKHASGLALSGGGIRSATFSLGVLVALARRGLLPQFDFLSTVSGGGYLGSFLTAFLNSPPIKVPTPGSTESTVTTKPAEPLGLRANELPFHSDKGEAKPLRHIRHHSKYLASGSLADRLRMMAAQLYGMALNGVGVVVLVTLFAVAEHYIRDRHLLHSAWSQFSQWFGLAAIPPWMTGFLSTPLRLLASLLAVWAIVSLMLNRGGQKLQKAADTGIVLLGGFWLAGFAWVVLGYIHNVNFGWPDVSKAKLVAVLGAIPALASAFATLGGGKIFDRVKMVLGWLSVLAAPLFLFAVYFLIYPYAADVWLAVSAIILALLYFSLLDINVTSPHRHYRKKLAEAYLIQQPENPDASFTEAVELKLSDATSDRAPYHLINAALNVPASKNPAMQGRLTDFFVFSRAFCGSPLTGYKSTTEWEAKDAHLNLGTAMAISGAAAAPQMGLGTRKRLTFWLALLNVRLGYWLRKPGKGGWLFGGAPGLWFLLKEMRGSMDERSPWLYVSDGGHIENLGVYELLRRRCKYIVAIDGEQDQRMTFAALTTLQRLAAIDLGVKIDINLDDLRLNEKGLSRSHFRFCRITYPGVPHQYGYLLYLKLSLTGNEGEFLRRYRLDEPDFPHHSTADQFFTEAQFEAYRSLGEHVGDKLFLRALVGDEIAHGPSDKIPTVQLDDWFLELAKRMLEPMREK